MSPLFALRLLGCVAVLAANAPLASAMAIVFDYTYDTRGFFTDPNRRQVLEAAANTFEARLTDQLTGINPGGSNTWSARFSHPGTGANVELQNLTIAPGELRVYAGGRVLSGDTLGIGGPGGRGASGSNNFVNNVFSRGQPGALAAQPTDFGPWGGFITFDTQTDWYFDPDVTTQEPFAGRNDFYSIAIHELAHLLGFGTAPSWRTFVQGALFTGPKSRAENFGLPVPLDLDGGHWADGTQGQLRGGGLTFQEAAMDPTLLEGTRKFFTELDYAGLDDLGWNVIPEPATVLLLGSGVLLLGARRRTRDTIRCS